MNWAYRKIQNELAFIIIDFDKVSKLLEKKGQDRDCIIHIRKCAILARIYKMVYAGAGGQQKNRISPPFTMERVDPKTG